MQGLTKRSKLSYWNGALGVHVFTKNDVGGGVEIALCEAINEAINEAMKMLKIQQRREEKHR
jgi:hypothetical protein